MTENAKRVAKLRQLMKEQGIDAYVIPTADFHQSEYVGEHFKARAYITGFSGSYGTAICAGVLDGIGLGLVLRVGGSTGAKSSENIHA